MTYLDDMEYAEWQRDERNATKVGWALAVTASQEVAGIDPEREACGYVVDGRVVLCENVAQDGGVFSMGMDDIIDVYTALENGTLEGIWHSHPQGHLEPSTTDWLGMPRGIDMYIIILNGTKDAEIRCFKPDMRPGG